MRAMKEVGRQTGLRVLRHRLEGGGVRCRCRHFQLGWRRARGRGAAVGKNKQTNKRSRGRRGAGKRRGQGAGGGRRGRSGAPARGNKARTQRGRAEWKDHLEETYLAGGQLPREALLVLFLPAFQSLEFPKPSPFARWSRRLRAGRRGGRRERSRLGLLGKARTSSTDRRLWGPHPFSRRRDLQRRPPRGVGVLDARRLRPGSRRGCRRRRRRRFPSPGPRRSRSIAFGIEVPSAHPAVAPAGRLRATGLAPSAAAGPAPGGLGGGRWVRGWVGPVVVGEDEAGAAAARVDFPRDVVHLAERDRSG